MQTIVYLLFWALLFMFMMRFGCGSHIMGHRHHGHHGHRGEEPHQAIDPVCGMTVATAGAKNTLYEGKAWYFCSTTCRDKFEAAPQQYARGDAPQTMEGPHHAA